MIGIWDYTVIVTYISLAVSVFGITQALSGNIQGAILCLALSGILDMFDGKIARTKKDRTEEEQVFGIQIDSLCDLVCFGVFPAIICYTLGMNHKFDVGILILFVLFGLVRLAYFNVTEEKRQREKKGELRHEYQGLPITTIAIFLPIVYVFRGAFEQYFIIVLDVVVFVTACLYVLDIPIKKPNGKAIAVTAIAGGVLLFKLLHIV